MINILIGFASFCIPIIILLLIIFCSKNSNGSFITEEDIIGRPSDSNVVPEDVIQTPPADIDYGHKVYVTMESASPVRYQTKLDYVAHGTSLYLMETSYSETSDVLGVSLAGMAGQKIQINKYVKLHVMSYSPGDELIITLGDKMVSTIIDSPPTVHKKFLFVTPVIDTWCSPCAVLLGDTTGVARMPYSYDKISLDETTPDVNICWANFSIEISAINDTLKFYLEGTGNAFHSTSAYKVSNMKIESLLMNRETNYKALSRSDMVPETMGGKLYYNANTRRSRSDQVRMMILNMTNIAPTWTRYEIIFSNQGGRVVNHAKISAKTREVYDTEYMSLHLVVFEITKNCVLTLRNTAINEEIVLEGLDFEVDDEMVSVVNNPQYITVKDTDYIMVDPREEFEAYAVVKTDDYMVVPQPVTTPYFLDGRSYRLYSNLTNTRPIDLTQTTVFANDDARTTSNNLIKDFVSYPSEETIKYSYKPARSETTVVLSSSGAKTVSRTFISSPWSAYPVTGYHPENRLLTYDTTFTDEESLMISNDLAYGGCWTYVYNFENFSIPVKVERGEPQEFQDFIVTNEGNMITIDAGELEGFVYNLVDMDTLKPILKKNIQSGAYSFAIGYDSVVNYKVVGIKGDVSYVLSEQSATIDLTNTSQVSIAYDRQFNVTTCTVTIKTEVPLTKVLFSNDISFDVVQNSDGNYVGTFTMDPTPVSRNEEVQVTSSDGASLGDAIIVYEPPVKFVAVYNHVMDTFQFKVDPGVRYQPEGPYTVMLMGSDAVEMDNIWSAQSIKSIINMSNTSSFMIMAGEFVVVEQDVKLYKDETHLEQTAYPKNVTTNMMEYVLTTLSPYNRFYIDDVMLTKFDENTYMGDISVDKETIKVSIKDEHDFDFVLWPEYAINTIKPVLVQKALRYGVMFRMVDVVLTDSSVKNGDLWYVKGEVTRQEYTALDASIKMMNDQTTCTAYSAADDTSLTTPFTNTGPLNVINDYKLADDGTIILDLAYEQTVDDEFYVTVDGTRILTKFSMGIGHVEGNHGKELTVVINDINKKVNYIDPNVKPIEMHCYRSPKSLTEHSVFVVSDLVVAHFRTGPDTSYESLDFEQIEYGVAKIGLDYFHADYIIQATTEMTMIYAFDDKNKVIGTSDNRYTVFNLEGSVTDLGGGIILNNGNGLLPVSEVSISEAAAGAQGMTLYGQTVSTDVLEPGMIVTQCGDISQRFVDVFMVDTPYVNGTSVNGVPIVSVAGGCNRSVEILQNKSCMYDPELNDQYENYYEAFKAIHGDDQPTLTKLTTLPADVTPPTNKIAFYVRFKVTDPAATTLELKFDNYGVFPVNNYVNSAASNIVDLFNLPVPTFQNVSLSPLNEIVTAATDMEGRFVVIFKNELFAAPDGLAFMESCTMPKVVTSQAFDKKRWLCLTSTDDVVTYGGYTFYRINQPVKTISPSCADDTISVGLNVANVDSYLINSALEGLTEKSSNFVYDVSHAPNLHQFQVYSPNSDLRSELVDFEYSPTHLFVPDYKNSYVDGFYHIETVNRLYDFIIADDKITINDTPYMFKEVSNGALVVEGPEIYTTEASYATFKINGVEYSPMLLPDNNLQATVTSLVVPTNNRVYGDWNGNRITEGTYTFAVKFSEIPKLITNTSKSMYDFDVYQGQAWRREVYKKYVDTA